jgi:hypothetical protein
MEAEMSANDGEKLCLDKALDAFKFYEEAASKTKDHAWSQTTWLLSLNVGILAFAIHLYAERGKDATLTLDGLRIIEWISAGAGVVLCVLLYYVLGELGTHIRNYWTVANRLRDSHRELAILEIPNDETTKPASAEPTKKEEPHLLVKFWRWLAGYEIAKFCQRLRYFAAAFIVADVGWALIVTRLLVDETPGGGR